MKVPVKDFLKYAGVNVDRWHHLVGRTIQHSEFGPGSTTKVSIANNDISIWVNFPKIGGERQFGRSVLFAVDAIDFPDFLAEQMIKHHSVPHSAPRAATSIPPQQHTRNVVVPAPKFSLNQEVCLRQNPEKRGYIKKVINFNEGVWTHQVFFSAHETPYITESELEVWQPQDEFGSMEDLLCDLALVKLRRSLGDTLYALYGSRTKFEVYQFKPALKFLANADQRLLIADEVGLGKTIEAGIIYLELQARLDLDRVLIVCPSGLRQKWQDEMKARFDEEFVILDSQGTRNFLDKVQNYSGTRVRGIISLELIRRRDLAEAFADVKLDLVIIDEAHHCRNTATLANAVASVLAENADAALLLTATPLQMGQEDLFNLLNILSPGEFDNVQTFIDRLEPNKHINRAAQILSTGDRTNALTELRNVEQTTQRKSFQGNPYYHEVVRILSADWASQQEMITAQRRLIELNTLASVFTRTRKRDIAVKVPIRTAQVLPVHFTPAEKKFYQQAIQEVREEFLQRHWTGAGSGFVTIMKERQVASCISAYIRRRYDTKDEIYIEDDTFGNDFAMAGEEEDSLNGKGYQISNYQVVAAPPRPNISVLKDSKFEVFWQALKTILNEDTRTKVLVFSFFRDTNNYLYEELKRKGINVRVIHGGFNVWDRYKIIEEFRDNPEIRVLVTSDVGSEGLDFQFCDTLFNYDLPWNPMKVEQRIGRIDRFGQESDRVRIYNLIIEDSIESRILYRLYERIEIFKHSIGDIEAILGEQIRELTQAVFSKHLTPEEEVHQVEQASRNIMRKKQDMEEFEQKKMQFLGQEAIFSTIVEKTIESGRYVSAAEMQALVSNYIKENFPLSHLVSNGPDDASYTLHANEDLVHEIKTYILQHKKNDGSAGLFLYKLRPGKEIPLTFSSDLAYQRKLLEFITPRHPLAQAALDTWKQKSFRINRISIVQIDTRIAPPGNYYFFIFSFIAEGVDKDSRIIPVVVRADNGDVHIDLSKQFLHLAQTRGKPVNSRSGFDFTELQIAEESAELYMIRERDVILNDLMTSNVALINARLNAVEQSYQAKQRRINRIQSKVSNRSILRMYESQLRNMEAKYQAKKREIESKRKVNVHFDLDIRGYAVVVHGT